MKTVKMEDFLSSDWVYRFREVDFRVDSVKISEWHEIKCPFLDMQAFLKEIMGWGGKYTVTFKGHGQLVEVTLPKHKEPSLSIVCGDYSP
jgi:hypothetical protein